MKLLAILGVSLGSVLLFLLATASGDADVLAKHYFLLLTLNSSVVALLLGIIGWQLLRLRRRLRTHVFGSKLALRLVLLFSLLTVLPGALIYTISVQFLTKSIETWFDVRVDKALDQGLNLGRLALHNELSGLAKRAENISRRLSLVSAERLPADIAQMRAAIGLQEISLFSQRGRVLQHSGPLERPALLLDAQIQRELLDTGDYHAIESSAKGGLVLRVVVQLQRDDDSYYLQLLQPVPKTLSDDAESVEKVRGEYQRLSLSRDGLKVIYGLTLTLSLLLAVLTGIAAAFLLSERLSEPLKVLAAGTQAVAQGDYSQRQPVMSRDELGLLTLSFNQMTHQLSENASLLDRQKIQLEAARGYLEGVLVTLTSGVLALDDKMRLRAVNPSASEITGFDFDRLRNMRLTGWKDEFPSLQKLADSILDEFGDSQRQQWQTQLELVGAKAPLTLLVRGARLKSGHDNGYVVVFDDITDMLQAQRDAAWGEVARRLAHEIKNPLTPIQLSAERLQHRLHDKLGAQDAAMLARATDTIVHQVAELKHMVDAFKDYARSPRVSMLPLDLNDLLHGMLALYDGNPLVSIDMAAEPLPIAGDATLLRQVVHNLLQNALDAVGPAADAQVCLSTCSAPGKVLLVVQDNGPGIPEDLRNRVFEPYVTTKAKGTGLGLAIVKKIVEEHHGKVRIRNVEPHGARIEVELPLAGAATAV